VTTKTILVVDDEPEVRAALRAALEAEGWRVREAGDTRTMIEAVEAGGIDLVTLDLGLGADGGLACARELRSKRNLPVVVVTGRGDPYDRARGLEAGADDYVVKPFDVREVAIRVRRVLERYEVTTSPNNRLEFDHSTCDLRNGTVEHKDGRNEQLTDIERKLLALFVTRPERVLSRDDINQALHGRDWSPYDRTIDGHVARLRRKIEPSRETPTLIKSVRGVGYVFNGEVKPVSDER
jgi:two-component system phosphate regulon response regulator OmpR